MRILFCGQAPSRDSNPAKPFSGKCGQFLAYLLGTSQEQMLLDHDFMNVLDEWPGKGIGGDKFPMLQAKVAAERKLESMRGRTVVLLGNNVARAFGSKGFRYLAWYEIRSPKDFSDVVVPLMAVVPHPSGVNRYYNKSANRQIVSAFLQKISAHNPDNARKDP